VTDSLAKATPDASKQLEEIGETLDALVGELSDVLGHPRAAPPAGRARSNPFDDSETSDDPLRDGLPFSADSVSLARAETQEATRTFPLGAVGKNLSHRHLVSPQPVTKFFSNTSEKLRRIFHAR
jgi:hypothetical protein